MSPRSLFLVPLLAGGFFEAPLHADRLLVAGTDGFVMQADTADGVFEYFACQCAGPIIALAADRHRLYAGDEFGQLLVFNVHDGTMLGLFSPGIGPIQALAAAGGAVFAGTEDGQVAQIDLATGQVVGSRTAPSGVRAMLAQGGYLFVGGSDGAIYRAPVAQGAFEYFSCFCFFDIQAMVMEGGDLVIADGSGIVARVSDETGEILGAFSVGPTNSMATSDGALLFYYEGGGGAITRVDSRTGQPLEGGFTSPINVQVMLVIKDGAGDKTRQVPTQRKP